MATSEILALSLGLSVLLAALAYGLVRFFETRSPDPVLREKAWAMALYLPALPVVIVGLSLLMPPSTTANAIGFDDTISASAVIEIIVRQGAVVGPVGGSLALGTLVLAGLVMVLRLVWVVRRTLRLRRLIRVSVAASPAVRQIVQDASVRLAVPMPQVRIQRTGSEALVAGLLQPVLLLPAKLIEAPHGAALRDICAHELAHLKRGDHRALWMEEALLTVMAFNPVLGIIRDRRSAAREEACDATALAQAGEDTRRLYARSLLDALRASPKGHDAPALTFTSSRRILVMRRLKAILSPAPTSGICQRLTVLGLGVAVAAVAGTSSLALSVQRESVELPVVKVASTRGLPAPRAVIADVRAVPSVAAGVIIAPALKAMPAPIATPVVTPDPEPITNPTWVQPPRPLSYPAAALEQGSTSGSALLSCTVESTGRVSACTIVSEDPVGAGYGAAALEAAASARLSPRTVDGAAASGTVRFTVRFRMAAD